MWHALCSRGTFIQDAKLALNHNHIQEDGKPVAIKLCARKLNQEDLSKLLWGHIVDRSLGGGDGNELGMFDESLKYFWARMFLRGFLVVTLTVALEGPVPAELYALTAKWYRALPFKLVIFVDVWFPIVRIFRAFSSLSSCLQYFTWENKKEDVGCHTYWGCLQRHQVIFF